MLKYLVVYASETGNTKQIAEEIFQSIPDSSKELVNVRNWNGTHDAETYFIGFWANRRSCSLEIIDLISSLHGKNVAFFGTCGLGQTKDYFEQLAHNACAWLSSDNRYLGSYFCQGKMPMSVRDKYEACRDRCSEEQINHVLQIFDEALKHPDKQDLLKANIFASRIIKALKKSSDEDFMKEIS